MRLPLLLPVTSFVAIVSLVSLVSLVAACSDDEPNVPPPDTTTFEAGTSDAAEYPDDAGSGSSDAEKDSANDASILEPTKRTTLEALVGGVSRTLDRAQFGTNDDATTTLHLEAHEGGAAGCPETEQTARTLVLSKVPRGKPGDVFETGITASFLDFTGDQITADNPTTQATAVKVTVVAFEPGASVELEVVATFPEGAVTGRLHATYCADLSK